MDAIFLLGAQERHVHLLDLMRSLGATYICLWFYLPHPDNCLLFYDGRYQEDSNQPTSSSGSSIARRLFEEYCQLQILVTNDQVPGSAFVTNRSYMEATQVELQLMAYSEMQRLFYREARIKTAVFMGCRSGEIEIGWSNTTIPPIEVRNMFSEDFSRRSPLRELSQAVDPNRHSSSSSPLISLSTDSPDCSSLTYNVNPRTTHLPDAPIGQRLLQTPSSTSPLHEAIQHLIVIPSTSNVDYNPPQVVRSLTASNTTSPQQNPHPTPFSLTQQSVDAEITRAILAVLTSPSSPSSSPTSKRNLDTIPERPSSFLRYNLGLGPRVVAPGLGRNTSLFKRALGYYRRLNVELRRDRMQNTAGNPPTTSQLHHMISERKRREKINESFQALRSLLPPDTKKDKPSVLTKAREHLTNLKAQVAELTKDKEELESQFLRVREAVREMTMSSSGERLAVRIANAPESSAPDGRVVDVQVFLRTQNPISDMVITVLEFLKRDTNVRLMSVEASTLLAESSSINRVILRLRIEGNEWDESAFQEAIKIVLEDLAR